MNKRNISKLIALILVTIMVLSTTAFAEVGRTYDDEPDYMNDADYEERVRQANESVLNSNQGRGRYWNEMQSDLLDSGKSSEEYFEDLDKVDDKELQEIRDTKQVKELEKEMNKQMKELQKKEQEELKEIEKIKREELKALEEFEKEHMKMSKELDKAGRKALYTDEEMENLTEVMKEMKNKHKDIEVLPVENINLIGRNVKFDTPPVIKEGRTLLPVRAITEGLGADVQWNSETKQVTITKDDKVIILTLGSKTVLVNGEEVEIDTEANMFNNRTYVPIRFISETLGSKINWDQETQVIDIIPEVPEVPDTEVIMPTDPVNVLDELNTVENIEDLDDAIIE